MEGAWRGDGVEALRAEEAGLGPVSTQDGERAGAGRQEGEQAEEAGEHGRRGDRRRVGYF